MSDGRQKTGEAPCAKTGCIRGSLWRRRWSQWGVSRKVHTEPETCKGGTARNRGDIV